MAHFYSVRFQSFRVFYYSSPVILWEILCRACDNNHFCIVQHCFGQDTQDLRYSALTRKWTDDQDLVLVIADILTEHRVEALAIIDQVRICLRCVVGLDAVTNGSIAFQPFLIHLVQHRHMDIPIEQLQAFLQEAKATGVYEMYYIERATGLRRGELLRLKWADIDLKNGIIKVRRQVARVDGQIVEAPLKTKNSYRTVTISRQAIEVLKQQKEKTNDQYVFPSPNGGPISPDSVNNMLKRVLARAGIPKVRFHDLRHTFATIALQNGVDIKTVSGMLGHFSAGFTLDTYAHVTTAAQKEAAQTMANVLTP